MIELHFRVYNEAYDNGFVAKLGKDRFFLLLALAKYMDENGKCYPTQEQLAGELGIGRKAVNRILKSLRIFEWNGKPVVTVKKHKSEHYVNNEYTILQNPLVGKFYTPMSPVRDKGISPNRDKGLSPERDNNNNAVISDYSNNFKTPKDVVTYFCEKYRETYHVNYEVGNFRQACSLVKNKLMANFTAEQIKTIIDVIFAEYETRWKSSKYPRPVLGGVHYRANEAMALADKVRKQEARLDAARHEQPQDVEAVMAMLDRKKV